MRHIERLFLYLRYLRNFTLGIKRYHLTSRYLPVQNWFLTATLNNFGVYKRKLFYGVTKAMVSFRASYHIYYIVNHRQPFLLTLIVNVYWRTPVIRELMYSVTQYHYRFKPEHSKCTKNSIFHYIEFEFYSPGRRCFGNGTHGSVVDIVIY